MSFSPVDSRLYEPLFSDPQMAAEFSDKRFVRRLLEVEAALAVAQGRLGIIPAGAAGAIAAATEALVVDLDRLRAGIERSGVPIIALVGQLQEQVGEAYASYVHWGATTQDIIDTALVLQIRSALEIIERRLRRLIANLAGLSERYRDCLMAGRTHSQQALPITFGLKAAGWLAPLLRHRQRLAEIRPRLLVVQLGGAAGTLASYDRLGVELEQALASELKLAVPLMPWHTQRDALVEIASWLSSVSGSLAKMAQDIILLAQSEVAEVRESADPTRGGSSAMPQKSNPIVSELIIAMARSNASSLSAMHQSLIQEHERATHGWQMEWLNLPQMFTLTSAALNKALFLSEHMVVNEEQMRENVKASNGLMLAEAITLALSAAMGRVEAKKLVQASCQLAVEQGRHLVDVVEETSGAPIDWLALRDEAAYLGSTQALIDRVLRQADEHIP